MNFLSLFNKYNYTLIITQSKFKTKFNRHVYLLTST